jgi:hypothetical protein
VSMLRSLCAQRLAVAIETASAKCMVEARCIRVASVDTSYYTRDGVRGLPRSTEVSSPTAGLDGR